MQPILCILFKSKKWRPNEPEERVQLSFDSTWPLWNPLIPEPIADKLWLKTMKLSFYRDKIETSVGFSGTKYTFLYFFNQKIDEKGKKKSWSIFKSMQW